MRAANTAGRCVRPWGWFAATLVLQVCAAAMAAEATDPTATTVDAATATRRGLNWLAATQRANGTWSDADTPALTGLALWAFARGDHPRKDAVIAKARTALLTYVREDGGIYRRSLMTGGLSTYNTAICMTALHALRDPELTPVILNARSFVAASQNLGSDRFRGGFGYAQKTFFVHADLQNTAAALQAMRLTGDLEDRRPAAEGKVDINWQEALQFMSRLQNGPDAGPEQAGGFAYKPGESPAGTTTGSTGTVTLRATGSMTYSGLLSLLYAQVGREDPRVRSALQWASTHWSLEQNPGVGDAGLFFFYNVMSRALAAVGQDTLPQPDGKAVAWRGELIAAIVRLQKPGETPEQGYWVNEKSSRFWEGDPVLVTAYAILALQSAAQQ